jgi:hypothetical protein
VAWHFRSKASAEEASGIIASSIAYYGTYSINESDKTLLVNIEGSRYANLVGGSPPPQKRIVTSLTADELRFTKPERQLVLRCKLCGEGRKHSKTAIENALEVGNRHRPARHPRAGTEPPR